VHFASVIQTGWPATIIWITFAAAISAEPPLLSARQALGQIAEQRLPVCQNVLQLIENKKDDAAFLSRVLREAGWEKVGTEYILSLNDLADGLRDAANEPPTQASCEKIRLILSDLHTKRKDCEKVGHSRTEIPVEVSTNNGQNPVLGLEVYLRWIPAGDHFDTEPKRLKGFSSPARGSVPIPGEFEIFAKDPSTGSASEPERLSIGGAEVFRWALQVQLRNRVPSAK
jgi:hypothetical protein